MSQKQAKFSRNRKYREDNFNDEYYKPRRPILFSSDDVERMAVERSRAKLIRQLVSKPPESSGEFSSYYCGPNQLIDPVYSATSHTVHDREPPHNTIIPTYPSLVNNLRWHPGTTEPTSVYNCHTNDKQNIGESSNFTCRCKECGGKHCRGLSGGEYKPRIFKDNITRFTDNSTMTPKLNDACCGSCTPVTTSRKTSDVSVADSDIAVREEPCPMAGVSQVYVNCDPVSILKKKKCENVDYDAEDNDNYCAHIEKKCRISDDFQEAVRDTEEDVYYELNSSVPMRSFPKVVRNKPRDYPIDSEPRKNIYNEGISDLTITLLPTAPVYPERYQAMKNLKPGYSRTSFVRKGTQRREEMPFCHNTESRYHYSCRTPQVKSYYGVDDNVEHETYTKKFKKTYSSKPMPYYNTESVKFPRKVLTSERDIESYVGGRFMKVSNH